MHYYFSSVLNELWYKYGRFIFSYVFFITAKLLWIIKCKKKARYVCAASLRYGIKPAALVLYKKIIEIIPYNKNDVSCGVKIDEAATRTIIIKWPTFEGEIINKGILVITFTKTFSYYLKFVKLDALDKYFHVVLEPSWSGYADPDIIGFVGIMRSVIVQSSEIEDRVLLNCFPNTFVPVSFGASDWVDSKLFENKHINKIYDSIYIANTNPIKRVHRYLDAVREIVKSGRGDYIGCLVCASWGGAQDLISDMVNSYNLKENIVLKFSLTRDEVIDCLNRSKVNVLLSYKEGSNRSLFEAIFCDIPVICIQENVGVNKSYINEFTGLLVADVQLEDSLVWIRDNYETYKPRKWAIDNIDPRITTNKLYDLIQNRRVDLALQSKPFEVYAKTNNPEVSYYDYPTINHKKYSENLLRLFFIENEDENPPNSVIINDLIHMHENFLNEISNSQ